MTLQLMNIRHLSFANTVERIRQEVVTEKVMDAFLFNERTVCDVRS